MKLRLWESGQVTKELDLSTSLVRMGRDPRCEFALDATAYPKVSSLHAELRSVDGQWKLTSLSKSNRTLLNDVPIDGVVRVQVGDRIRLGFTGPAIEIVALNGPVTPERPLPNQRTATSDQGAEAAATVMAGKLSDYLTPDSTAIHFQIGQGGIIGRDPKLASYLLDHPHVSRVHARVSVANGRVTVTDLGSSNGTFCNGARLRASRVLTTGDTLDIGPFTLQFDGSALVGRSRADNVQLVVSQVGYSVNDNSTGKKLELLRGVEFVLNPGEFLCILGPSGSGKSTLLNVMSGRRSPTAGKVHINGRDLHENFSALKQDLSVVPQACVLHETLTVEQSFRFTSELRLPPDLNRQEVGAVVDSAINTVGLNQRRQVRISQLSGGQLKRAGLGGELLSEPSLLFLDEVTSGLDEHSDGEMMQLFRSLADAGKTLVCITHNLAHVEDNCHLVAVLTVGGQLAFYGSPAEALKYFRITKLANIYTELKTQPAEKWAEAFRSSPLYPKYIGNRLPNLIDSASRPVTSVDRRSPSRYRQSLVLLRRTIAVWRGDMTALAALFGQALLVAVLLCLVFGSIHSIDSQDVPTRLSKIHNLLFLVTISCFWLGCNNSVKELVKERPIFRRERDYNLMPEAYLISKFVFFALIGIAQSLLLGAITLWWFDMPGNTLSMLGTLVLLSLAGTSLGLALSAISKSEEVAVAFVPIAIIPQIILAGVVATLATWPEWLARLSITAYWGQHAVNRCLEEADRTQGDFQPSYLFSLGVICIHAGLFLATTWLSTSRHR